MDLPGVVTDSRAPIREPSVVEIPLRRRDGEVRAVAVVDLADAELATDRWFLTTYGYVARRVGGRGGETLWLHRVLMGLERGDERVVDHVDGDPLNNRRSNLRVVSRGQNQQNRRGAVTGSSSRFRGVSWDPSRGKWKTQAMVGGRRYTAGRFADEEEAALAIADLRREVMPFTTN